VKFILRTCKGREKYADYVRRAVPSVETCFDDRGGAMKNFLKSLELSGKDSAVNLEDDIVVTKGFEKKAISIIEKRPDAVIQFFSMRGKDLTQGSRWDYGSKYLMAQCTYFPEKISQGILAFSKKYHDIEHKSQPLDSMVALYLKATRRKYWIHCPNLVDHRTGVSLIDPRRAKTNRQSFTFVKSEAFA